MSTEPENPTWGDPPPQAAPGPGWNGRRTLVAIAVAVGIAAAGGGVIYAAGNSEAARQGLGGPRGYGVKGGPGGLVVMGGPFGDAQHGEFQNGEVTEVSDASITVKSPDGYTTTYRVDEDTRVNGGQGDLADIDTGDTVTVVASGATADAVLEGNAVRGDGGGRQQSGDRPPADGRGTPPTR
ncbi:hypothetical protein [Saccharothrix lopnurensis]|uniref:DUF5666 domain-containing protein n=1 Tax=Saccharothrix lopnurensis TaxID=1670621 RepID=A0ABW1P6C5_9PSEU